MCANEEVGKTVRHHMFGDGSANIGENEVAWDDEMKDLARDHCIVARVLTLEGILEQRALGDESNEDEIKHGVEERAEKGQTKNANIAGVLVREARPRRNSVDDYSQQCVSHEYHQTKHDVLRCCGFETRDEYEIHIEGRVGQVERNPEANPASHQ